MHLHQTPTAWLRSPGPKPAARRGIAALELAIVSPFFAIVLVGMFELTRVMIVKEVLDDAARKGCRSGIIPGHGVSYPTPSTTGSNIYQDICDVLHDAGLDPTKAILTVTVGSNAATVYSIGGSYGAYTVSQSSGSGTDPLSANSGTLISVKVGIDYGDFAWTVTRVFVASSKIESENVTMAKQ